MSRYRPWIPFLRIKMRAELRRLQQQLGIIFVHVTHSQDEAMALADLVVVMNAGKIEQAGPPRAVFNAPRTEFVARFIGAHNVIVTEQGPIAIRADRLDLRATDDRRPRLQAFVRAVEYQGTYVHVALDSAACAELVALLPDGVFVAAPLRPGDDVFVGWSDADVHLLGQTEASVGSL
jgi:putative spermidine/putrescine transport system ATP-binding protein